MSKSSSGTALGHPRVPEILPSQPEVAVQTMGLRHPLGVSGDQSVSLCLLCDSLPDRCQGLPNKGL